VPQGVLVPKAFSSDEQSTARKKEPLCEERRKGMAKGFATLIVMAVVMSHAVATASTFRCGTDIVRTGDTTAEVLIKCGKPDYTEESASITTGTSRKKRILDEEDRRETERVYTESSARVENWYYDRGFNDFIYVLTFIGGRLANVKTEGYGGKGNWEELRDQGRIRSPEEDSPSSSREPSGLESETGSVDRPGSGRVDLVGSPYGARVYLNDYYTGNVPCTIEKVEEGRHHLLVTSPGYKDWKERIVVKDGTTLWLTVHLEREGEAEEDLGADKRGPKTERKLYKWTDESGRIHITDRPPPDAPSR
jgi:hypothetical protein